VWNFVPFWCCCVTARKAFLLQGKVATLISWGGLLLYSQFCCKLTVSFSLLRWCCLAKITTMLFDFLMLLDRILYFFRRRYVERRFWWRHDYVITRKWCGNVRNKFSVFLGKWVLRMVHAKNYETVYILHLLKLCRENCGLFFRTRCIVGTLCRHYYLKNSERNFPIMYCFLWFRA